MDEKRQMKSSQSSKQEPARPANPRISPEMYGQLVETRGYPRFTVMLHIEPSGELQFWYEHGMNFPIDEVIPGLEKAIVHIEENLVAHLQGKQPDNILDLGAKRG